MTTARPIPDPATIIAAAVGQKVLQFWLQNRHQTRYPLVLNLRNHDAPQIGLIVDVVSYALRAVDADAGRFAQARDWLASMGGPTALVDRLGADAAGCPLPALVAAGLAPQGYAASVRALGRRSLVTRRFLDFLSARLGIPDEVARSLNRRFAS